MKYSFMTFSCPQLTLDEALGLAKRLGYDGIEPRIDSQHQHGVEIAATTAERKAIKGQAAASGIALSCIATSCQYCNPATTKEMTEHTLRAIDLAADVGAPRVRVFGGTLAEGVTREQAFDLVVRALAAVADHAKRRGVVVCLETHDAWCDPAHVAEVMNRVNHPGVGVNWDLMHPVRVVKATMDQAFQALKPWIRHIHFHDGVTLDGRLEFRPIGQGQVDHRRAVQLLKAMPYADHLSGEWIRWEPYETHLPRELATMKRYERGS